MRGSTKSHVDRSLTPHISLSLTNFYILKFKTTINQLLRKSNSSLWRRSRWPRRARAGHPTSLQRSSAMCQIPERWPSRAGCERSRQRPLCEAGSHQWVEKDSLRTVFVLCVKRVERCAIAHGRLVASSWGCASPTCCVAAALFTPFSCASLPVCFLIFCLFIQHGKQRLSPFAFFILCLFIQHRKRQRPFSM